MSTTLRKGRSNGHSPRTPVALTAEKVYEPTPLKWECPACRGNPIGRAAADETGALVAGEAWCVRCKGSGHVQVNVKELPADTTSIPLPVLTLEMLKKAWKTDRRMFGVSVLLGALMLWGSSFFWPLVGGLNVGGVLWFTWLIWYVITGRILDSSIRRTVAVVRWSHGIRVRDWQKWWAEDAARIDNGQKRDMYGQMVAFIDATADPVTEFDPFLAPLPDGSLKPSDSNYRITPDRLAMSEAVGQRYKRRIQDEPSEFRQIVTQTALMLMSFGGIIAIYMAVTYVPQILEGP